MPPIILISYQLFFNLVATHITRLFGSLIDGLEGFANPLLEGLVESSLLQGQGVYPWLCGIPHPVFGNHLLGGGRQMMSLKGFGYVSAFGFANPESAARMLVNEIGEVIDAIVYPPESFGTIVLAFALLPTVGGDQSRVAICWELCGNATFLPLFDHHCAESLRSCFVLYRLSNLRAAIGATN